MRYVAAYLLSALGGNASPQAADIKKILESVGIEADNTRMEKVCLISRFTLVLSKRNARFVCSES